MTVTGQILMAVASDDSQAPSLSRDACSVIAVDQRQSGRAYTGRCEPTGCGGSCAELLSIIYDTGETVLDGCQCEQR